MLGNLCLERCLWFGILNATLGQFFQGLFFKLCTLSASQGSGGEAVAEKKKREERGMGKGAKAKARKPGSPCHVYFYSFVILSKCIEGMRNKCVSGLGVILVLLTGIWSYLKENSFYPCLF